MTLTIEEQLKREYLELAKLREFRDNQYQEVKKRIRKTIENIKNLKELVGKS